MDPLTTTSAFSSVAARALVASFLACMMFSMGLEVGAEPGKDKQHKRRKRHLLVRALATNLLLLPLISFALVHVMHGSGVAATAVLLVAATPGGRFAPGLAKIAHADLGLAVEITLFLTKLTGFTAPITIRWLLGVPGIELHELQLIAEVVVLQILPYVAGRRLRRARPAMAQRLARPLLAAEAITGCALFVLLIARGEFARLAAVGARGWVAGALFAVVSIVVGWIAGGRQTETRRAFAITAAARNLGLGLLIAGESFDGSVQLAYFAIWLMCGALDLAFAATLRTQRLSLQPLAHAR